jgi:hypothetical protein
VLEQLVDVLGQECAAFLGGQQELLAAVLD